MWRCVRPDGAARESVWESRSLPLIVWSGRPRPLLLVLLSSSTGRRGGNPNRGSGRKSTRSTSKAAGGAPAPHNSWLALLNPQPRVVFGLRHQPSANRILADILLLVVETLVRPQYMVKRLVLPHRSGAPESSIHAVGGRCFDRLQYLDQAIQIAGRIAKWRQQEMYMVGHDDRRMNMRFRSVVVQTVPQHDIPNRLGQWVARGDTKRDEESSVSLLKVRQATAILVFSLQRRKRHGKFSSHSVKRAPSPAALDFC
jgi:hypothetical protein